jgi:hypothetical protein
MNSAPPSLLTPPVDLTVENFANYIAPVVWEKEEFLNWPPDVFALAAGILLKSGAYAHAVSGWQRANKLKDWVSEIEKIAYAWRKDPAKAPQPVREWHKTLVSQKQTRIFDICKDFTLCSSLLQLSAVSDVACVGVGCTLLRGPAEAEPALLQEASKRLLESTVTLNVSTLCKQVSHSTLRVLPKMHTPQSGITIRSLTHNLALCSAGDVNAKWAECISQEKRHCLNLLLAPWPLTIAPAHFESVPPERAELQDMAENFGFFEYNPPIDKTRSGLTSLVPDDPLYQRLKQLLENAKKLVTKIDGVIFPELALTRRQYERISQALMSDGIFLICGVRDSPKPKSQASQNYLQFDVPFLNDRLSYRQDKHHRWRLDKRQIVQYGLGSCLDVASNWWEHISIGSRDLYFVVLDNWLTVCPLICEDLARQDPIGELVRSVGPNLVIALLMDGPQLPSRWPARYATVLADDPGSSVLTLTSIGMAELSRPPNVQGGSRAVALWKDAKSGEAVSIELPPNMEGVILSLSKKLVKEYTADGRDDNGMTGYPTLSGIHFVRSHQ